MDSLTTISTLTASFLASLVEMVEAFTIVLAVGIIQGWRPAFLGTAAAFVTLAALVAVLGPLLGLVPIHVLQYIVGILLVLFGLRWLRKAILRSIGVVPLHDEETAFTAETDDLRRHARDQRANFLAGLAAYKAVLLEGVEVVFIVIAVGTAHGLTFYAALGALAAFIAVLAVGLAVHRPLSRVPENTLKYVVGLMLTTFGVFWTGEGLGVAWPGEDLALFGIFVFFVVISLALTRILANRSSKIGLGVSR